MINPATGLPMSFAETLTATEYEKVREERYNAAHAAHDVWSEDDLDWVASTGIQTAAAPAPEPAPAPAVEPAPAPESTQAE